jgi:hypothetical protein
MLPKRITKEQRLWLVHKTISKVKVVRPTKEERSMYESRPGPSALKFYFTDGSFIVLDSWIGNFVLTKEQSPIQNSRSRSYFTISRKEGASDDK